MRRFTSIGILILLGLLCFIAGAYFLRQRGLQRLLQSGTDLPITEKRLRDTGDVSPVDDQNFSVSPDGRWLFYASSKGNSFEPLFVLYGIADERRIEVQLDPRVREIAAQGFGPLNQAGCWSPDSSRVFLIGDNDLFTATLQPSGAQLTVHEAADQATLRRYSACPASTSDPESLVRVAQISDVEIQLLDPLNPTNVLGRHQAQNSTTTRLAAKYFTISPGRRYVAYIIEEYGGSFVNRSSGYVLNRASNSTPGTPQHLVDGLLGPIRWGNSDTRAYGCVQEQDGTIGIYQWEIAP